MLRLEDKLNTCQSGWATARRIQTVIALSATALAAACNAADNPAQLRPAMSVRDSAGIEIVESHRPAWKSGEGWTLVAEPAVVIGREDGPAEYLLHKVIGAVRLSDGRIVVADNGSSSLRYFDKTGVFLKSVGRRGAGPGEFASLQSLFRIHGDSLMTHDNRNSLITFDAAGTVVQFRNLSVNSFAVLDLHGAFLDGTLIRKLGGEFHKPASDAELDSLLLQVIDRTGKVQSRFAFRAPRRPYAKFDGEVTLRAVLGGPGERPVLEQYHVLQSGSYFAVGPTKVFFGDSDRFEFLVASNTGTITRIMRVTAPLEKIPESVKTDSARYVLGRAIYKANETIWPDVYPPFRKLIADRDGNIWAAKWPRAGESLDTSRFTVFDTPGAMLGEVALPNKLQIYEIGSDYVLGLEKDDLGVERVLLYRLRKVEVKS